MTVQWIVILFLCLLLGELFGVSVSETTQNYQFEEHQCRAVKRNALEDPVKNGTCSRPVRPRRGLKGVSLPFRVRKGME